MQDGHAAFRSGLGLTGITGIEEEHPVDGFGKPFVGMAKDHYVRPLFGQTFGERGGQGVGIDDVVEEYLFSGQRHDFRQAET